MSKVAKTVLMIAPLFPPQNGAGVHRTLRFVKYLGDFGWDVVVVTRQPKSVGSAGNELLKRVPPSVEVVFVEDPVDQPVAPSAGGDETASSDSEVKNGWLVGACQSMKELIRPAWELVTRTPDLNRAWSRHAARKGLEVCGRRKVDLLYTTGPPHSTHFAGLRISKSTKIPLVSDFRDPWARKSWVKKINPWGRYLAPFLERRVVSYAARVIANTDSALASFHDAYPSADGKKFLTIPNGYDPELFSERHAVSERCKDSLADDHPIILCHPGSLYGERNPIAVVQAISLLREQKIHVKFVQVGYCDPKFDPEVFAQQLGVGDAVEVKSEVPQSDVLQMMNDAEILLLIQPNAPYQVPGKLFEMLMFEHPIVAVCDSPPTAKIVVDSGGFAVGSDDVPGIAKAIKDAMELRGTSEFRERRSQARERFDGRSLTKQLADCFVETTSKSR